MKSKNTKPERDLQEALLDAGLPSFNLHFTGIEGKADIAFVGPKVAVFVDGCFWHGCPIHYRPTKSNKAHWDSVIKKNRIRRNDLRDLYFKSDWKMVEVWECEIRINIADAVRKVREVLYAT